MLYGNNSNNIANLLRYQEPHARQLYKTPKTMRNPQIQPNNKYVQDISEDDILMLQPPTTRKSFRMKSSKKNMQNSQKSRNNSQQQYYKSTDHDAEALALKLEQIVQYYDQRHHNLQTNLMERLNGLEDIVMRQVPKIDNTKYLKSDLSHFKQTINQLRHQQQQLKQAIQTLKVKTSKKNSQYPKSVQADAKEKQKMTVLFMEVVRIADVLDQVQKNVGSTSNNYQNRIQQLQFKLRNSEKNVESLTQNNFSGNQLLTKFGDKVMDRLQTAQNNLLLLGKEKIKQKQKMNELILQNDKMSKDVETVLKNMHGDFQNKLEQRISDAINKLMNEHQSRINSEQQIKRNIDMRQRMNQQKRASQKQQIMSRYQNMDIQFKNQLHKKQQSIKILHSQMENQIKNVQKIIYDENHNRKQHQIQLKNQIKRLQDNFRKQYDIFKTHSSDTLQKIGQLVRQQVQVRVKSEMDLKKLTSQIANQLINDLNSVKQTAQISNKKLNMSIKQVMADSAEKFGQISHYIDKQVNKVSQVVSQKYNKMKSVFNKIALQLKEHLTTNQSNRKNFEGRLKGLEDNFDKLKDEVSGEIDQFYTDLDQRLNQEKQYVHTFVFKKTNDLAVKIAKIQEQSGQQMSLIKGNIQQSKQMINKKMSVSRQSNRSESDGDIKQLRTIVFNIKRLTQEMREQNIDTFQQLKQQLRLKQTENRQQNYKKQRQTLDKIQKHNRQIENIEQKYDELSNKVNSIVADGNSSQFYSQQKIKKMSEDIYDLSAKIKNLQANIQHKENQNQDKINDMQKVLVNLRGSSK